MDGRMYYDETAAPRWGYGKRSRIEMWGEGKLLILDLRRNPVSKKEPGDWLRSSNRQRSGGEKEEEGGRQRSNDVQVASEKKKVDEQGEANGMEWELIK